MNESDNELKKALAENGSFDPEKAEELKNKAVGAFSARMRKVERICWVYLVVCACIGLFAYYRYQSPSTTSTKSLVGYGILLLIAYESTVLIKLWYWVVNSKLSVLKEIKQLRLESPAAADPDALLGDWGVARPTGALPRWERTAWLVGLIVIVVVVVEYATPAVYRAIVGHDRQPSLTHEGYVSLAADGSGSTVTKTSWTNKGVVPVVSGPFECGSQSTNRWIDGRGRELPVTVTTRDGRSRYTVNFIDPVMPGERHTYKRVTDDPALATQEGDLWTCRADWGFGPQDYGYTETVVLPEGAEIVSVDPEPDRQFVRVGAPVLRFKAILDRGEHFKYTIQYRLSGDPTGADPGQGPAGAGGGAPGGPLPRAHPAPAEAAEPSKLTCAAGPSHVAISISRRARPCQVQRVVGRPFIASRANSRQSMKTAPGRNTDLPAS